MDPTGPQLRFFVQDARWSYNCPCLTLTFSKQKRLLIIPWKCAKARNSEINHCEMCGKVCTNKMKCEQKFKESFLIVTNQSNFSFSILSSVFENKLHFSDKKIIKSFQNYCNFEHFKSWHLRNTLECLKRKEKQNNFFKNIFHLAKKWGTIMLLLIWIKTALEHWAVVKRGVKSFVYKLCFIGKLLQIFPWDWVQSSINNFRTKLNYKWQGSKLWFGDC